MTELKMSEKQPAWRAIAQDKSFHAQYEEWLKNIAQYCTGERHT